MSNEHEKTIVIDSRGNGYEPVAVTVKPDPKGGPGIVVKIEPKPPTETKPS